MKRVASNTLYYSLAFIAFFHSRHSHLFRNFLKKMTLFFLVKIKSQLLQKWSNFEFENYIKICLAFWFQKCPLCPKKSSIGQVYWSFLSNYFLPKWSQFRQNCLITTFIDSQSSIIQRKTLVCIPCCFYTLHFEIVNTSTQRDYIRIRAEYPSRLYLFNTAPKNHPTTVNITIVDFSYRSFYPSQTWKSYFPKMVQFWIWKIYSSQLVLLMMKIASLSPL